jgi:hypothetical protein
MLQIQEIYYSYQLYKEFYPHMVSFVCRQNCYRIINVDFTVIATAADETSSFCEVLEKIWEYSGIVHQLFMDFKKAYGSNKNYCTTFSVNLVYPWNC